MLLLQTVILMITMLMLLMLLSWIKHTHTCKSSNEIEGTTLGPAPAHYGLDVPPIRDAARGRQDPQTGVLETSEL